jgi:maltose O-acetyltransferase
VTQFRTYRSVRRRFPTVGLEPWVLFKGALDNLRLGERTLIQSGCVLHLGGLPWCQNVGCIEIGDDSVISPHCVIYGCGPGGVHIGKRLDCGPNVGIFASRTNYQLGVGNHIFEPIEIGDDVIIFANSVISPGVIIGTGSVIAAGSVVISDVPQNALVGGVPARVLREHVRQTRANSSLTSERSES